jgi:hypothetical protein
MSDISIATVPSRRKGWYHLVCFVVFGKEGLCDGRGFYDSIE